MSLIRIIGGFAFFAMTAAPLLAEVKTWEPPLYVQEGNRLISRSDQYRVEVLQDGKTVECFVYLMHAMQYTNKSLTTSWASFDFDGKVTVRVTRLTDTVFLLRCASNLKRYCTEKVRAFC
jgi:hypothetical protein